MQAKEKLGKTVTIRAQPRASGNATGNVVLPYLTVTYVAIVDDLDHPANASYKWLQLGTNQYVNYIYPPNGVRFDLIGDSPPPPPPPPPQPLPSITLKWSTPTAPGTSSCRND